VGWKRDQDTPQTRPPTKAKTPSLPPSLPRPPPSPPSHLHQGDGPPHLRLRGHVADDKSVGAAAKPAVCAFGLDGVTMGWIVLLG